MRVDLLVRGRQASKAGGNRSVESIKAVADPIAIQRRGNSKSGVGPKEQARLARGATDYPGTKMNASLPRRGAR